MDNTIQYDEHQLRAIEGAVRCSDLYRIGGYAGTGKTTIGKQIISQRAGGMPCTFTGKAAGVLNRKLDGIAKATTIHQTIYRWDESDQRFYRKSRGELTGSYFYIDEGSMVPVPLWRDIREYGLPCIVLGDPGQLEPVGEDARLMHSCDVVLEKIHRYGHSIAGFAQEVRLTGEYPRGEYDGVRVMGKSSFPQYGYDCDTILCGFNKTRVAINKTKRSKLTGSRALIDSGDRLVGLMNNWNVGVTNGMLMDVIKIRDRFNDLVAAEVRLDNGSIRELLLWTGNVGRKDTVTRDQLSRAVGRKLVDRTVVCDYGWCLTVHKFQGSEDRSISLVDEQCSVWSADRWRYTGCTRSQELLDVYTD